ncbi:peptidylprolyl isomerase (plasmid) [Radiobacillus kanasensis]|uniref:peptidylprolyl isomerase n=1 Tax=Radiobacillus kanasensis TaxID=2844358 RepID=UPI001E3234D4|nr:peptidylprolyl isomerase [Radiobacillus kanasensis]UFU01493.1 peptidylprolyl isomerase [Radiobacillus kanasensis]
MTRKFLWGIIILLLVTNLTTVAIWMIERNNALPSPMGVEVNTDEPVATIGKEEIFYEEWVKDLEANYGKKALEELVNREVVSQLAKEEDIEINDKLVEREISLLFTMEGPLTEKQIEAKRKEWEKEIRYRLTLEELLTKDIEVESGEVESYYNDYKGQYDFKESIQLSHIVLPDKQTAEKVYDELEAGASFAALAREYTMDEETKANGGYLGYYTENDTFLLEEYYNKAMEMEEHTYSEPFLGGTGTVILYLHRKLPDITFEYEELEHHIQRELALEQIEPAISAKSLWNEKDVKWIFDE